MQKRTYFPLIGGEENMLNNFFPFYVQLGGTSPHGGHSTPSRSSKADMRRKAISQILVRRQRDRPRLGRHFPLRPRSYAQISRLLQTQAWQLQSLDALTINSNYATPKSSTSSLQALAELSNWDRRMHPSLRRDEGGEGLGISFVPRGGSQRTTTTRASKGLLSRDQQ